MSIQTLHTPRTDAEFPEEGAEVRMRQALSQLGTARPGTPEAARRATYQVTPGAGRHRFRQDGEVPVVRTSLAAGGRGGKRQAHAPVEGAGPAPGLADQGTAQEGGGSGRQVQALSDQLQAVQTRLGHAELALSEAVRTAQARVEEAAGLRHALAEAEAALARLRADLATREQARGELVHSRHAVRRSSMQATGSGAPATRRKAGRPLGSTSRIRAEQAVSDPAPVKWWTGD